MIDASRFNTNYPWGAIFKLFFICATVAGLLWPSALISAQHTALDFEDSPVSYSQPETENALNRLQAAINSGKTELLYDDDSGYLPEVLKRLDISSSSQMLTFLKSSLQRPLIGPKNPRAIYFNDDTYVGYVPGGFIELIVPDVKKGMVFYSLQQNRNVRCSPTLRANRYCRPEVIAPVTALRWSNAGADGTSQGNMEIRFTEATSNCQIKSGPKKQSTTVLAKT